LSRNKQQRHLVPKNCPKTFSRGGDVWPWRGVIVVHYQVFLFFSTLSLFLPTAQYFSLFLLVIVSSALEFLFIYMPVHGKSWLASILCFPGSIVGLLLSEVRINFFRCLMGQKKWLYFLCLRIFES
jgi:hypothetical protein